MQLVCSIFRGCLQTTLLRSYPVASIKESTSTGRISLADSYHVLTPTTSCRCEPGHTIQEHDSTVLYPNRIFRWRQVFAAG